MVDSLAVFLFLPMRHADTRHKLGRPAAHRKSLMANLACSLIEHGRIRTTVAKAKALRPYAEKLVTLGKKGTQHHKGLALSKLRQRAMVKRLFEVIAPLSAARSLSSWLYPAPAPNSILNFSPFSRAWRRNRVMSGL